jgi:2,3,4,5-tetrahydropyridine-2-carboxylate N-succinyltransferase
MADLKEKIEELYNSPVPASDKEFDKLAGEFIASLNSGEIRTAEPAADGSWKINIWIKQGILLLFKYGRLMDMSVNADFRYFDKHTLPLHPF